MLTIYFIIGIIVSRKAKKYNLIIFLQVSHFSVPAITATLLATQIGGGMFLGTAQNPIQGSSLYILGMALDLLF